MSNSDQKKEVSEPKENPNIKLTPDILLDSLMVVDALESKNLSKKLACQVAAALQMKKGVPLDVINIILAFAMSRTPHFSPYCCTGEDTQLRKIEYRKMGMRALPQWNHNHCLTSIVPYPLMNNEIVFFNQTGVHSTGIGLVSEDWFHNGGGALRFNPHAVVWYVGIELLHSKNPELKYSLPYQINGELGISVSYAEGVAAFWKTPKQQLFSFVLPDNLKGKRPLFAGGQVWNKGKCKPCGETFFPHVSIKMPTAGSSFGELMSVSRLPLLESAEESDSDEDYSYLENGYECIHKSS